MRQGRSNVTCALLGIAFSGMRVTHPDIGVPSFTLVWVFSSNSGHLRSNLRSLHGGVVHVIDLAQVKFGPILKSSRLLDTPHGVGPLALAGVAGGH